MKSFNIVFCAGSVCGVLATLCWSAPTEKPAWSFDKSLSGQLVSAVTIGKYQIQPPKNYISLHSLSGPNKSSADSWAGVTRTDGTRPYIMFIHVSMPSEQVNKYSLKEVSDKMLSAIERHRKQWKQSPTEEGTINGMNFMRTYWQGLNTENGRLMHGFSYVAKDNTTLIQLSSQDFEPYQKNALSIAEASALTFKKQ
jgi:hypothetical protein